MNGMPWLYFCPRLVFLTLTLLSDLSCTLYVLPAKLPHINLGGSSRVSFIDPSKPGTYSHKN